MRRFYAPPEAFCDGRVSLDKGETCHLRDVLRLRVGQIVNVFDGNGTEYECAVESVSPIASLKVIRKIEPPAAESPLNLTLGVAITKGEKFDLVVQKSVELGARRLVPILANRCDVKIRDGARRLGRWRKIALEAAKQTGRSSLMSIEEIIGFAEFLRAAPGEILFFSERGGRDFSEIAPGNSLCAVIGPEGGWDDTEIQAAKAAGARIITLSGRILRAETAAIAITAILQHRFGDLK